MRRFGNWKKWAVVCSTAAGGVVCLAPAGARAGGTIDFETIPGGTPAGGLVIDRQFEPGLGVTFSLRGGGWPVLAHVGGTDGRALGFVFGPGRIPDTPAPGQPVGSFFLAAHGMETGSHDLVLSFRSPVAQVSGDILDIDHVDAWSVAARAADGTVVASESLSAATIGAGDGVATPFRLGVSSNEIATLTLAYTGGGAKPGFGWDNFSFASLPGSRPPTAAPLPPAAWIGGVMMGGVIAVRTIRRRFVA